MERIGFANEFYTLWDVTVEEQYYQDGYGKYWLTGSKSRYTYIKNISTSLEKVKELYPNVMIDEALKGTSLSRSFEINKKFEPVEILWFGKYKGQRIEDLIKTDFSYVIWLHENTSFVIKSFIETLPEFQNYITKMNEKEVGILSKIPSIKADDRITVLIKTNAKIWEEGWEKIDYFVVAEINGVNIRMHVGGAKEAGFGQYVCNLPLINGTAKRVKNKEVEVEVAKVGESWIDAYNKPWIELWVK